MYLDEVITPNELRDLLSHPVDFERLGVVLCDDSGAEMCAALIAEGEGHHCEFDAYDIVRVAHRMGAKGVIMMHSHPRSVTPVPSEEDVDSTMLVHEALKPWGAEVLDHHIYGMHGAKVFKFRKAGVRW